MKISFIGAGKVGFSLGKYLSEYSDCIINGYYSRNPESAKSAAEFTGSAFYSSVEDIIAESDIIMLTVNDSAISDVWNEIRSLDIRDKLICHCSGILSSSVFEGIEQTGAYGYSLHMLYAVSDKYNSYEGLGNAIFTLEGNSVHIKKVSDIITACGNTVQLLDASRKAKYHAAAVMASNLSVALAAIGSQLMEECGFAEETAEKLLLPLIIGNAENIKNQGIIQALTGPVDRNDVSTVIKHLECLDNDKRSIYIQLTRALIDIAQKKHKENNYNKLSEVLRDYEKYSIDNK